MASLVSGEHRKRMRSVTMSVLAIVIFLFSTGIEYIIAPDMWPLRTPYVLLCVALSIWWKSKLAAVAIGILCSSAWLLANIGYTNLSPMGLLLAFVAKFPVFAGIALIGAYRNESIANTVDSAFRDQATGLYNRRGFLDVASVVINLARRNGKVITVWFGDMDGLKRINDEVGHAAGDAALIEVAKVLKYSCRSTDAVARVGGDEFAWVSVSEAENAIRVRLFSHLSAINDERSRAYPLGLSIAAVRLGQLESLEDALRRADALMYQEKQERKRRRHNESTERI